MTALAFVALVGAGLAGAVGLAVWVHARHRGALEEAGRRLGLRVALGPWGAELLQFSGKVRDVDVHVESYVRGSGRNRHRRLRVVAYGAPLDVAFRAQGLLDDAWQTVTGRDVRVGDPTFDAAVVVGGDASRVVPLLDEETRALLRELVERHGAVVKEGRVEIDRSGTVHDPGEIVRRATAAVGAVRRLRHAHADPPTQLERLATGDPTPGVRRAAVHALQESAPARLAALAPRLVTDRDPGVRALAAAALGDGGVPFLRRMLVQTDEPEPLVLALAVLGARGEVDAEASTLPLLDHASLDVRLSAVEALARLGDVDAGRLSLPEGGDAGAVSLAAEPGRLSEARKPQAT